ncbi:unnamed protein product [Sphenostylis stenocarpa]|uniref:Uncharacterized protein n=1 Tax=Sphenostylis stenocarpa TaxID=92480 RepID=A0AA86SG32_9FABA|nr:unnamed protein product [Sphenostylis stenocarpa]
MGLCMGRVRSSRRTIKVRGVCLVKRSRQQGAVGLASFWAYTNLLDSSICKEIATSKRKKRGNGRPGLSQQSFAFFRPSP